MAFDNLKTALGLGKDKETVDIEDESYDTDEETLAKGAGSNNKVVLISPRAFSESQTVADQLKKRNAVIVSLKKVTNDQARRIVDFLSGTLYAIGGDMQQLGSGIYLCTPKNIDVDGRISEDNKEKKNTIEDELDF